MFKLSQAVIAEKNKLASGSAMLILFEIRHKKLPEPICIVLNNENIEWNGQEWAGFPVELDDITEDSKGETPSLAFKVSNVDRTIQGYMEQGNGVVGGTVTIIVVNSDHLESGDTFFEEEFAIAKSNANDEYATFTLGPSYPLTARRPFDRYTKNHCPFKYGDIVCGIGIGVLAQFPECDKTLAACRIRGNAERFGGEPAIPGGFYV